VKLPDAEELQRIRTRVRAAGVEAEEGPDGGFVVRDPSGNAVALTAH
jgi:catechol 2,3-dioxygenase-like lactoylglutathione lyase family enzyme